MTFFAFFFVNFLIGCGNSIYFPNSKDMQKKLSNFKRYYETNYNAYFAEGFHEDREFRFVGYVSAGIKRYEIVYYVFDWNMSSSPGAWHETRKLVIFENSNYIRDYNVNIYPQKITIENKTHILMINEDGSKYSLDLTDGLPDPISVP